MYPLHERQVANIATDPYTVEKFFKHLVEAFMEGFIDGGLFGEVQDYYGNVETQGQGSLHIHLLFGSNTHHWI